MRRSAFGLILLGAVVCGCDDSNMTGSVCDLECGHGACFMQVTKEKCLCDDGYSEDALGMCTIARAPYLMLDAKPSVSGAHVSFSGRLVDVAASLASPTVIVRKDGDVVGRFQTPSFTFSDDMGSARKASYTVEVAQNYDVEPLYVPVWHEETLFDWRDAVMYFAFIDRFSNGDTSNDAKIGVQYDWMGGDFAGLKSVVESGYFTDLGVNALWISSVSMNSQKASGQMSAYHSYWPLTTGYTDKTASIFSGAYSNNVPITPIEPHFGTLEELKALVRSCHDRGIRVLVDFAVNHVEEDSPVYKLHPDWFNGVDVADRDSILCEGPHDSQQNWNIIPETCWFGPNLPDFNYNKQEVREFVLDHARWLVRTTGIDGFRLDAVKHMPMQMIRDLRAAMDELYQYSDIPFYMVGETFDGVDKIKQYIGDTMLHGQFDFPLYNTIRGTIMNGDGKFWDLKDFVAWNDTTYGSALMSTFLGNHDVARAISHIHHDSEEKYGNNPEVGDAWAYRQLKLAWTFLMTSPMIPLIYYGDEYGLEGANDPDNRRMMEFGDALNPNQQETLQLVRKLGQIRRQHPALSRGKRQTVDAYDRSYTYVMRDENETILVGINDSDEPQTYNLPERGVNAGANGWIDLLDESNVISETTSVTLTKDRQIIVWKEKK
ncbi:MAG: hypothetical protein IJ165_15505 [Proteobacteria bacterium]|nr:hypothetical protein [Pseudomonadota bacterium]